MPRPNARDRQFMMYFPSEADRERWRKNARKSKMSFTDWIYSMVESKLADEDEEAAGKMVRATIDTRDRAVLMILLKTGIRRGELIALDVADADLPARQIQLKPAAKRTNRTVFIDEEAARSIKRWLVARETRYRKPKEQALFVSNKGTRLERSAIDAMV